MNAQDFRKTSAVARAIGVSRSTLDRMLEERPELRPEMWAGRFLWTPAAVERVREAREESLRRRVSAA